MPSKRTNDSVDRILEELSHEQAERGIRDSVTDRQVDAILQSLGHGSMEESSGGGSALGPIQKEDLPDITLGKGNNFNTEDRFSTAVLDDLLGDLPSMRAAKKNKPGPAAPARRPASVPEPRRMPEVEPKVEKQNNIQTVQPTRPVRSEPVPQPARPAPAQTAPQQQAPQVQPETKPAPQPEPRPADATSGDTTRTSVIKAFLGRRVPEADSKYLDEGKKDFTNFFGTSVAVVPDDMKSEQERQQTPKKKGLFGFGYATDTGEFEPINVSVSGRVENQSTQQLEEQLPRSQDVLPQDEPDEMELREQEPPRHYAAKKKGFFASLFGGKKHDVYDELESYDPYEGEPDTAPVENWEVPEQPREEPETEETGEMPRLTATNAGLSISGRQTSQFAATGKPPLPKDEPAPQPEPQPNVYRKNKKRDTVEFTPRKERERTMPFTRPAPRREAEPVGEPVMTPNDTVQPQPAPAPQATTGFTMQLGDEPVPESTQSFLHELNAALPPRRKKPAPKAAPVQEEPASGDTFEELPQELAQTLTGQIRLSEIAEGVEEQPEEPKKPAPKKEEESFEELIGPLVDEKPNTAEFVRGIEQSINLEKIKSDSKAKTEKTDTDYQAAAQYLSDPNAGAEPEAPEQKKPGKGFNILRFAGKPKDETTPDGEAPFAAQAAVLHRHEYESTDDAPVVRHDLELRVMITTGTAIAVGAAALIMIVLGTMAATGANLGPLDTTASTKPLLVTMLILLAASAALCWQTMLGGLAGLINMRRGNTADTMPAMAAVASILQCIMFLAKPEWYNSATLCLMTGPAALLLCGNAAGKAIDAHTIRDNFTLVSAGMDHAVAYRLKDAGVLRTVTAGLAEPRPNVLVSRPTRLMKGFLAGSESRRTSDKNQQQFARILLGCGVAAFLFTLLYRKDAGTAFTALAGVLCLGAPLAGTLISAMPMRLMQRSAAQIGAVIPGWKDIRLLGRVNVLQVTAQDLFPKGCITLRGIKPVRKEDIELAIIYSASMLADVNTPLKDIFLGMTGDNRKLLCKVENLETLDGLGYVGWINGERVMIGSRRLMDTYDIQLPSMEYERRHTVNQRRVIYLAVSGKLFSMFQVAYQSDPDTAAVLDSLRRAGLSLIVDCDDFNCDEALLQTAYNLPVGTVKVLSGKEHKALEPAVAWLPESEGNMLHLGSFASFVGGLEAAAGAAEGEHRSSMVLSASVLISCILAMIMALAGGLAGLPLPALALYQVAWAVLAMIFPLIQRY